ncbi:hypothetical protein Scep_021459 [Stephania cephalantha]|uniref:Uncharacterized protein n=1 Tax=Stephania cephalantha TaxID=152367 RepID=A0AAP0F634_9MAGN
MAVTDLQIGQFVFSFLVSVVMLWMHFGGGDGGCSGFWGWVFNAVFNGSLLVLFNDFHKRSYGQSKRRGLKGKEESVREVAELYRSEKSFVVEVHRALSWIAFYCSNCSGEAKLQRRCLELTQATPNQPVDDEAVYFNVAGECPNGHVYGLGSLGRKKRSYADPGASTSQMPEMVPRSEFDSVAEQLRQVVAFMRGNSG